MANRLAAQGVNINLTEADRTALDGFRQVWNYNGGWWIGDPDIHRQAGLQKADIDILTFMLDWVEIENLQRQHEQGEPLND